MSFLNPALLAWGAAMAVPILIHLLNRRRFRQVPWAAMRFLRASIEKNRRRMQIEDLILLALRCLVLLLLALALARPALRAAAAFLETGRAAGVIVLDRSASLGATDGTRTRFDLARSAAEAAVDAYPAGSLLAVFLTGDRVEEAVGEPTYDLNLVRKTLREAPLSDLATDHAAGIARAAELLAEQRALRKEIVLVTDRQAWGWRRWPEIETALAAGRDLRLRVVFVSEPLEDNLAVVGLTRAAGFASPREPLRFQAEVANRGASVVRQVRATLHVDGGPAVDEAVLDLLGAGESRRLTYFGRLPGAGFHAVSVRLPRDRLAADDERTLMVQASEVVRVLVVDGDPESNSAFFLRNALQPVPPDAAADYFLQPRVVPPAQLAVARLTDVDAVILADVSSLTAPAVESLGRYVREGGVLLVFLGPRTQAAFCNDELLGRAGLLPASVESLKGNPESEDAGFTLQAAPYDHPVFALWNEAGSGSLGAARFRAAWGLSPAPARTNGTESLTGGQVMLRFQDGSPAAVERAVGRGWVMVFGSTAGTGWNDLAVRPAFVPFLHRAVGSLAEARDGKFNVRTGGRVTLRLPSELAGRDAQITAPGVPERRFTRVLRAAAGAALLEFDDTAVAGPYRVTSSGAPAPLARFAAQMDAAESDLRELTAERVGEIARVAQVIDWAPGMDLRLAFDRERVGIELWLPLALGVLLLGVVETVLAQAFSRSK